MISGCDQEADNTVQSQPEKKFMGTIVAVGDSLTEGLGVAEESAYPALLEQKLRKNLFEYFHCIFFMFF